MLGGTQDNIPLLGDRKFDRETVKVPIEVLMQDLS
jgi:hypothetical protein